ATPERADGVNVAQAFFDGRIASELRLWDALDADLLVPFHYYGIADNVDLRGVTFRAGGYDSAELSEIYTGNDDRAALIVEQVGEKILDPQAMRALGFCVSVDHAHYMAEVFTRAGIESVALSGQSTTDNRDAALRRLRTGEVQCIFTVDLFNEGVDVPEVRSEQVGEKILDPQAMRALGFCVSVDHAHYMAEVFTRAGIESVALSGQSTTDNRDAALRRLRTGEVQCIFTVDLFNEGVDVPEVDTVLMLRPTQSATVFLQQLGRGLRRAAGKALLTVLDFVGHQHEKFRFDIPLRAMTGVPRGRLLHAVENGFPQMPGGSQIVLDRVAEER